MLLDNESRGARRECILIAAQVGRRSRFRDAARDFIEGWLAPAHIPDAEDVAFAIGHGDDTVRRNLKGARDRLVDDGLHIGGRELSAGQRRPEQQTGCDNGEQRDAGVHGGALILEKRAFRYENPVGSQASAASRS